MIDKEDFLDTLETFGVILGVYVVMAFLLALAFYLIVRFG